MSNQPLGIAQIETLSMLKLHEVWHRRCGWRVGRSDASADAVMLTLVNRGLVNVANDEWDRPSYRLQEKRK